ncbi:MAG: RNA-binding domain-containing protein, partial [Candidatus Latescibacterota bacterium]
MDVVELRQRIARWEDLHTEFKERVDSTDDLASCLVAFANTDGGQLVIGVASDGGIAGVADADSLHRHVDNVAYNNCEPPVTVVQESVETDGKRLVVVNIPKGAQRPYRTNRGRYYIRTTSGRRDASREELLRLFQATESLYYDESPLPRLGPADLNLDALDRYLDRTGQSDLADDPLRLLRNWGLLADRHPTVGGMVLFGREPQRHLPFAQINAARFPGTD